MRTGVETGGRWTGAPAGAGITQLCVMEWSRESKTFSVSLFHSRKTEKNQSWTLLWVRNKWPWGRFTVRTLGSGGCRHGFKWTRNWHSVGAAGRLHWFTALTPHQAPETSTKPTSGTSLPKKHTERGKVKVCINQSALIEGGVRYLIQSKHSKDRLCLFCSRKLVSDLREQPM